MIDGGGVSLSANVCMYVSIYLPTPFSPPPPPASPPPPRKATSSISPFLARWNRRLSRGANCSHITAPKMLPPLLSYLLLLSSFTLLTVRQPHILFPGNIEEVAPMAATEKRATAPVNVNYSRFKDRARADSIDVSSLPFADTALGAVEAVARPLDASSVPPLGNRATAKIDLHGMYTVLCCVVLRWPATSSHRLAVTPCLRMSLEVVFRWWW
ncbi:uncharacterized protein IWZ02DRAFT_308641 [Phyllosticta citriasiana]|uniref:uncharacterized protein n=1 Tax=Phyllosticta citriasiana TaxID=595635 RepID=UPI0030FD480E